MHFPATILQKDDLPMKKPLIGLTCSVNEDESRQSVSLKFTNAILAAGAIPVMIPITADEAALSQLLDALDGVIFSGGGDIDPAQFGEYPLSRSGEISPMRDAHELLLARMALERGNLPMMGVCRGMQMLNVALGGTLYQDLDTLWTQQPGKSPLLCHRQRARGEYASHPIDVVPGTMLADVYPKGTVQVNSFHHQAVKEPGPGVVVSAWSPDGVAEAIELPSHPCLMGLQWHPESMAHRDESARAIFSFFADKCRRQMP